MKPPLQGTLRHYAYHTPAVRQSAAVTDFTCRVGASYTDTLSGNCAIVRQKRRRGSAVKAWGTESATGIYSQLGEAFDRLYMDVRPGNVASTVKICCQDTVSMWEDIQRCCAFNALPPNVWVYRPYTNASMVVRSLILSIPDTEGARSLKTNRYAKKRVGSDRFEVFLAVGISNACQRAAVVVVAFNSAGGVLSSVTRMRVMERVEACAYCLRCVFIFSLLKYLR